MHRPRLADLLGFHIARRAKAYGVAVAVVIVLLGYLFLLPPLNFPAGNEIVIPADQSFGQTAVMLEEQHVVRSAFLLKAVARLFQADKDVQAGRYVFAEPSGLTTVLFRLANGISGLPTARVTFPEGITAREMGDILHAAIPTFDSAAFVTLATPYEGTLFPDTYDIYLEATPEEVVQRLRDRYEEKIGEVRTDIAAFGISEEDAVIMASILEKEAKAGEERRVVSGILWKRIEIGMALQVDAVFGYIHGRDTYAPDLDDLESNSPYNTYKNRGLPPGPIGNPGIEAIKDAVTPIKTAYLYYLTGADGNMYYATTFEEHKKNKELYLR